MAIQLNINDNKNIANDFTKLIDAVTNSIPEKNLKIKKNKISRDEVLLLKEKLVSYLTEIDKKMLEYDETIKKLKLDQKNIISKNVELHNLNVKYLNSNTRIEKLETKIYNCTKAINTLNSKNKQLNEKIENMSQPRHWWCF